MHSDYFFFIKKVHFENNFKRKFVTIYSENAIVVEVFDEAILNNENVCDLHL